MERITEAAKAERSWRRTAANRRFVAIVRTWSGWRAYSGARIRAGCGIGSGLRWSMGAIFGRGAALSGRLRMGYGGSGPAQLALAVLLRFTDRDTARRYYRVFKWDCIATLPQTDFRSRWSRKRGGNARRGNDESAGLAAALQTGGERCRQGFGGWCWQA